MKNLNRTTPSYKIIFLKKKKKNELHIVKKLGMFHKDREECFYWKNFKLSTSKMIFARP